MVLPFSFTKTERRFRTRDVLVTFMNKHKDMTKAAGCIYNDLQSIMYSLTPMSPQVIFFYLYF